jgi:signal transduction histidine kinase
LPHRQADGCTLWHGFITDITERKVSEALMTEKSMQLLFQNEEKEKRAAELVVANKELVFQNDEKEKRAAELVVANKELVFQSDEKGKRAAELVVANKELVFQNDEKEKRAAELVLANKELVFQNDEKEKRAAELVVANKELVFQNEEKEKRAAELVVANKELVFQYEEKHKRAAELSQALDDAEAAISERKQNEKKMETLHDEMNSMLVWQVAQHTVAALAHEINQPLASLAILTEVGSRLMTSNRQSDGDHGGRVERREETLIKRMVTEVERAASVVRSLLISVNKPDITRASALVNELIGESIRTAQSEGVFGYAIMANYAADLPLVNVNRLQVSKVLLNLIHNSAQAMQAAQTPNGKIVLSSAVTDDGSEVSISVQDDGPGISALMQQEIFQPFISTKSHGLGLGLTISRSLIEAHGGKLWATQTEGQGATFHFTLPTAG